MTLPVVDLPECSHRGNTLPEFSKCWCRHPDGRRGFAWFEECGGCDLDRSIPAIELPAPIPAKQTQRHDAPVAAPGCSGCKKREEWLDKVIPGAGKAVAKVAKATGIKRVADWLAR